MTAHVLRWTVLIDDKPHEIGGGNVVHVDHRLADEVNEVSVWTLELPAPAITRHVQVFGTGQPVDTRHIHLGSVVVGSLVWHAFDLLGEQLPDPARAP